MLRLGLLARAPRDPKIKEPIWYRCCGHATLAAVMPLTDCATINANIREWALWYLRQGFVPLPTHVGLIEDEKFVCTCGGDCGKSAGKHPAIGWSRFQYRRPTPQQVHSWFLTRYAGFNVGHGAWGDQRHRAT